jgi:general L-amino acid transport system permease protein
MGRAQVAGGGDAAFAARERLLRRRRLLTQAAFVLLLALGLLWLGLNVKANLELRQIRAGFGFLSAPAGFNIGESPIEFGSADSYLMAFAVGVLNTLRVSLAAIVLTTAAGVTIGLARLSHHPLLRGFAGLWVQLSRNIPLLILLLALYLACTEALPESTEAWQLDGVVLLSKQGLQLAAPLLLAQALLGGLLLGGVAAAIGLRLLSRPGRATPSLLARAGVVLGGVAAGLLLGWIAAGLAGGWSHPVVDGLSVVGGAALSPEFLALWLGLSFFTSGTIAEIVRAGAEAVPLGQWEAAEALGLTRRQSIAIIIFPQALRLAIPPLASQYMNLVKNSSLAVAIGYPDIVSIANTAINQNGQALECIAVIMAVYLSINLLLSLLMNYFNARVTRAPR